MTSAGLVPDGELQNLYEKEVENKYKLSAKISELCKFAWAGSIAFFYAVIVAPANTPSIKLYHDNKYFIISAAALGAIAFVSDYLQYVFAYKHTSDRVSWIERTTNIRRERLTQTAKSKYSRLNSLFFVLKNCAALTAALLVATTIIRFVFQVMATNSHPT